MSAPQIDEAAPGELGSLTPSEIPVVGPTEGWPPRLASVTPIPAADDTGPIEPVEAPSFTAVPPPVVTALPGQLPELVTVRPVAQRPNSTRPDFAAAPAPALSAAAARVDSEPATIRLAPLSKPAPVLSPTPAPEPAPDPIPDTVDNSPVTGEFRPFPMERFYPVIYWVSVLIGLGSQIVGWGAVFGGGVTGYAGAIIVGGICELTMVTASDKGLNWVAQNLRAREFLPFLLVATTAAHIAVYMVYTHWHGTLGLYLAIVSASGFIGHMLDGGFKAMRQRRRVQEYERQCAEQRQRAAEEAERQRRQAAEAERQQHEAAEAERKWAALAAHVGSEPPRATRKGQKPSKQQLVALGVHAQAASLAELREAIREAGFVLPSDTTVKNRLAEVKQLLD